MSRYQFMEPMEWRALRILEKSGPAHELVASPLTTLRRPLDLGLAYISSEYQTPRHGPGREITITDAGRKALRSQRP